MVFKLVPGKIASSYLTTHPKVRSDVPAESNGEVGDL